MGDISSQIEPSIALRPFQLADQEQVVALWDRCDLLRPENNPQRDISRKLQVQPHMFLVATLGGTVVGTVMAGYEGHRGWINYLAVAPQHRGRGLGRQFMAAAERLLREAGCPKVNLQVRTSNDQVIGFYRRIGFAGDDVISLGKRLEA